MLRTILFLFLFFAAAPQILGQNSGLPLVKCWEISSNNLKGTQNASDNNQEQILLHSNEKIISIDIRGKMNWEFELEGELVTEIFASNNKIYFATQAIENKSSFYLHELSLQTGLPIKKRKFANQSEISSVSLIPYFDDLLVIMNSESLFFIKENGQDLNDVIESKITTNVEVFNDLIIFANQKNQIVEYNPRNKATSIIFDSPRRISRVFTISSNKILFADNLGGLFFYNRELDRVVWKYRTGGAINNITKTRNDLLISSFDNYIYYLQIENGKLIWKKRLGGRSNGTVTKNNDKFILSLSNSEKAFVIDLDRGKTLDQVNLEDDSFFVGSPIIFGESVIFSTNKGILSYGISKC